MTHSLYQGPLRFLASQAHSLAPTVFGLRALRPAGFLFLNSLSSVQQRADWGCCFERANAVLKHVSCRRLKRPVLRPRKATWQPCCYSSIQCGVVLACHYTFLLKIRDSTAKTLLSFYAFGFINSYISTRFNKHNDNGVKDNTYHAYKPFLILCYITK